MEHGYILQDCKNTPFPFPCVRIPSPHPLEASYRQPLATSKATLHQPFETSRQPLASSKQPLGNPHMRSADVFVILPLFAQTQTEGPFHSMDLVEVTLRL